MKKIKKTLLFISFILCSLSMFGQITINQGGTVLVTNGTLFYDAGGATGNDGNINYTITLTPAVAGEMVCLDFTLFNTYCSAGVGDSLCIFDGITTSANKMATLMGNYGGDYTGSGNAVGWTTSGLMPTITTPTIFCSTTGSLTISFYNINASQMAGWVATIKTYTPLGTPGCNIDITATPSTICNGQSVVLTSTGKIVAAAINNNFNASSVGTGWQGTSSATFQTNACGSTSIDNSVYLWMANAACPRTLTSNGIDVVNGGNISFDYRQASINSNASPCESPDVNMSGTTPEAVLVQYSTDNGTTWVTMKVMFPYNMNNINASSDYYNGAGYEVTKWNKIIVPIPTAASTTNTMFRWYMPLCTNASTDNWGLDNVVISSPKPSTITVKDMTASGTPTIGTSPTSPYNLTVSPTVTTTYQVTISDGTNSCTDNVVVTVNPCGCVPPTINTQPTSKTICSPGNTTFNVVASGTVNGYQWQVNTGSGFTNVSNGGVYSGATTNTLTLTGATTTMNGYTYQCIVTEAVGTCPVTTSIVTLTVNSVTPDAGTSPGDITCANPTRQLTATGGSTYSWSGGTITSGGLTATPTISAAGTYVVTVTNNGCTGIDNVVVNSNTTVPMVTLTDPTILTCSNTSTTLTAGGGGTYNWSNSLGTTATVTITSAGTYTVTVTNTVNGCTASLSKTVTNNGLVPTVSITNPTILTCTNASTTLTAGGGGTYNWSNSLGTSATVTISSVGTYTVTVTDASSGCTATMSKTVTSNTTPPTANAGSDKTITCTTQSVTLDGSLSSAGTYNWSGILVSGQGTLSPVVNQAGTYTLTVTNTTNGCTATDNVIVSSDNSIPTSNITATNTTICIGENITLTSSIGTTYLWSDALGTNQTVNISPTTTHTYSVTITNAIGCSNNSSLIITVNQLPIVNAPNQSICLGTSATITATGGGTYLWNTTDPTASITVTPTITSTYTVTVTLNGCTASEDAIVSVSPNPPVNFISNITSGCEPLTVEFTNTNVSTTILWNFGDGTTSTTNPVTHTYSDGVYDVSLDITENGCTATLTNPNMISAFTNPDANFGFTNIEKDVSFLSTSTNSSIWNWSFGDNSTSNIENPNHIYGSEGTYNVSLYVENSNGCKDSISKIVIIRGVISMYIPNAFSPNGDDKNEKYGPVFTNTEFADYEFVIYNRWDELLFQTNDYLQHWDGRFKGNYAQQDVYVWIIYYKPVDNKQMQYVGTFHLIK